MCIQQLKIARRKGPAMKDLEKTTLLAIRDQMASHAWSDEELARLASLRHGAISGLQQLLRNLDALRGVDLGVIAPVDLIGLERKDDA